MIANKMVIQNIPTSEPLRPLQIASTETTLEQISHRRLWRQLMKFFLACVQVRQSDLDPEGWQQLEYRNEVRSAERFSRFENYGRF
jgi:hypothetical protein